MKLLSITTFAHILEKALLNNLQLYSQERKEFMKVTIKSQLQPH